jgi:hypothetical protein
LAPEAWQEAVVDVDATARKIGRQVVRQDLHVARQNDQVGLGLLNDLLDLGFLRLLGLALHRQVMEGCRPCR